MKNIKRFFIFIVLCAITLSGCGEYSLPTANPNSNIQTITLSKNDSKALLMKSISEVIAPKEEVRNQLSHCLESSVKLTAEMKQSLSNSIQSAQINLEDTIKQTEKYNVYNDYHQEKTYILSIFHQLDSIYEKMYTAIEKDEKSSLKNLLNQFDNSFTQLQGVYL